MYLLAPFILQNFKNILRADPELPGCAIFRPKMALLSSTKNFWYKTLLLLSSTYWPFSLCKIFLKKSYSGTRVMMRHFRALNGPFTPNNIFFGKLLKSISSNYQPLSLCKILTNSSCGSRVMRMRNFWAQYGTFPQMKIFSENLLISLVPFIHAYLHAKNQSQILFC